MITFFGIIKVDEEEDVGPLAMIFQDVVPETLKE